MQWPRQQKVQTDKDLQIYTEKINIEQSEANKKPGVNSCVLNSKA